MIIQGVVSFDNLPCASTEDKINDIITWENGWFSSVTLTPSTRLQHVFALGVNFLGNREPEYLNQTYAGKSTGFQFDSDLSNPESDFDPGNFGAWFDETRQTLYLTRDVFGVIPTYYLYVPDSFVAFSTSLVSLIKMPVCRPYLQLDSDRIVSYSRFRGDQSGSYSSGTFFKNIKTVLPGHIISVSSDNITSRPFARFDPDKWNHLHSIEEYGRAFKDLFFKSVERTIGRDEAKVGSHLSGGMDSSSISAVAKALDPGLALHTLYLDTKTKYSDEIGFAGEVAEKIGSIHHEVPPSNEDFEIISRYTSVYGHPECMVISPSSQGSLMEFASHLGCKVLLIGHDGDSVVGSGLEKLTKAYFERDWSHLRALILKRAPYASLSRVIPQWEILNPGEKISRYTKHLIVSKFFEQLKRLKPLEIGKLLIESSRQMNVSIWHFFTAGMERLWKKLIKTKTLEGTILKQEFAAVHVAKRENLADLLRGDLPLTYKVWFDDVFNGQTIIASEQFFALGNHYALENRFPFYDKDLFELCISVPMEVKFGRGIGREHFREAMKGLLPESVRSRAGKANFSIYGREAALRLYHQSTGLMQDDSNFVWHFVDKQKYLNSAAILVDQHASESNHTLSQFHVTRAISLAIWFDWLKKNDLLPTTS
ncbi:asparagine synthase-related protein [Dyadobacter fanqingshengii]|uniref:asparagine synthase (glutamine-hydrolyzing) n=1 Tax=Dyadobacter fanqingshengii TaxID=2906443 RepID=A0A9X1P988_9BACT|nr:asparagine synthase-related protein [Dyadobacter fanqingshengii]MCF0039042.1 asparagine synthase-related protein [Dyadobacter fanqingshengii]USJ34136.1 asparagine synthase-related protein [Dyadobacter fanqingshengii]